MRGFPSGSIYPAAPGGFDIHVQRGSAKAGRCEAGGSLEVIAGHRFRLEPAVARILDVYRAEAT